MTRSAGAEQRGFQVCQKMRRHFLDRFHHLHFQKGPGLPVQNSKNMQKKRRFEWGAARYFDFFDGAHTGVLQWCPSGVQKNFSGTTWKDTVEFCYSLQSFNGYAMGISINVYHYWWVWENKFKFQNCMNSFSFHLRHLIIYQTHRKQCWFEHHDHMITASKLTRM